MGVGFRSSGISGLMVVFEDCNEGGARKSDT